MVVKKERVARFKGRAKGPPCFGSIPCVYNNHLLRHCLLPSTTMSSSNRTQASPPSERIRRLWPVFKQSVSKSRILLEHKVEALLDKAEKEHEKTTPDRRRSIDQHNAHKAKLAKEIREPHFRSLRRQWEVKLQEVGLRMEEWIDISNEEIASVIEVLGDPGDESEEPAVVPEKPSQPPIKTLSSVTYATSPPQPLAPSLSSSTRSTNVSTNSSYAFVDPSEFHSEEEDSSFFFPVVCLFSSLSSHVFTQGFGSGHLL